MKILVVHNRYQQHGGEDAIFHNEKTLLLQYGHEVIEFTEDNNKIGDLNSLTVFTESVWSWVSWRRLLELYREEQFDLVHFHNTFLLISPSAYYACKRVGVPVVQTLHNYRLLCPNAVFFRNGHVCEDCLERFIPWPGVTHACYRGNHLFSGGVASMLTFHRLIGTWNRMVDVYIALSKFSRKKFIQGGIPQKKIVVKPNFIFPDPGLGESDGRYAIFVGRLAQEKGLDVLINAWRRLQGKVSIKIVGDGPLAALAVEAAKRIPGVEWLGHRPNDEVLSLMKKAMFLVFPSVCYENFPITLLEAFATGLPVVASRLGVMSSLVEDGKTGLHFHPGDPKDLADQVEQLISHPEKLLQMRWRARKEYEGKYTAEANYLRLMRIYKSAISNNSFHRFA
jgi:glycosyltransferase involved in cell wall biosynthesis